jgi:hypothetical protein
VRAEVDTNPLEQPSTFDRYVADPWRRGQAAAEAGAALVGSQAGVVSGETAAKQIAQSARMPQDPQVAAAWQDITNAEKGGTWETFKAIVRHPEAVVSTFVESLPQSAASIATGLTGAAGGFMAGGPVGAAAGSMAGTAVGSGLSEYGNSFVEALRDAGIDTTKEEAVVWGLQDPAVVAKARDFAVRRGVSVGAFDGLTALVGGQLLRRAGTAVGRVAAGAGEVGIQAGGGMAGEATAQVASTGGIQSTGQILMEGVAELPSGAVETATGVIGGGGMQPAPADPMGTVQLGNRRPMNAPTGLANLRPQDAIPPGPVVQTAAPAAPAAPVPPPVVPTVPAVPTAPAVPQPKPALPPAVNPAPPPPAGPAAPPNGVAGSTAPPAPPPSLEETLRATDAGLTPGEAAAVGTGQAPRPRFAKGEPAILPDGSTGTIAQVRRHETKDGPLFTYMVKAPGQKGAKPYTPDQLTSPAEIQAQQEAEEQRLLEEALAAAPVVDESGEQVEAPAEPAGTVYAPDGSSSPMPADELEGMKKLLGGAKEAPEPEPGLSEVSQIEPEPIAAPVEAPAPKKPETQTGLDQMDLGSGIADSLHDMLYAKYQRGETEELGRPSLILQAAKYLRDEGRELDRGEMQKFANELYEAKEGKTGSAYQGAIKGVVQRWAAEKPAPGAAAIDQAAAETAEPTPAQAEAGNYKKAHVKVHGLDISIETPKGRDRTGVGKDGKPWSVTMPAHYGYVRGTEGADGDAVDVYLGDFPDSDRVFVVDQIDPETGAFDEHKVVMGVRNRDAARRLYEGGFSDGSGRSRMGSITPLSMSYFKEWLKGGKRKEPLSYKPAVQEEDEQSQPETTSEPVENVSTPPQGLEAELSERDAQRLAEAREQLPEGFEIRVEKVPYREGPALSLYRNGERDPDYFGFATVVPDQVLDYAIKRSRKPPAKHRGRAPEPNIKTPSESPELNVSADEARPKSEPSWKKGDRVRVTKGPQAGQEATLTEAHGIVWTPALPTGKGLSAIPGQGGPKTWALKGKFDDGRETHLIASEVEKIGEAAPEPEAAPAAEAVPPAIKKEADRLGVRIVPAATPGWWSVVDGNVSHGAKTWGHVRQTLNKIKAERKKAPPAPKPAKSPKPGKPAQFAPAPDKLPDPVIAQLEKTENEKPAETATAPEPKKGIVDAYLAAANKEMPAGWRIEKKVSDGKLSFLLIDPSDILDTSVEFTGETTWQEAVEGLVREARAQVDSGGPRGDHDTSGVKPKAGEPTAVTSRDEMRAALERGETATTPAGKRYSVEETKHGWVYREAEVGTPFSFTKGGTGPRGGWSRPEAIDRAAESAEFDFEQAAEPAPTAATATPAYGSTNKLVTADKMAAARERMRKKLSGAQLNSGMDPEFMADGLTMAVYHLEAGSRSFAVYAKKMVEDLGENIRPFLRGFYENARHYPGLDTSDLSTPEEIERFLKSGAGDKQEPRAAPEPIEQPQEGAAETAGTDPKAAMEAKGEGTERSAAPQPDSSGDPLVDALRTALARGELTTASARKIAKDVTGAVIDPGTPEAKDLDEAIERAVVLWARQVIHQIGKTTTPQQLFREMVHIYEKMPKLGVRTSGSI